MCRRASARSTGGRRGGREAKASISQQHGQKCSLHESQPSPRYGDVAKPAPHRTRATPPAEAREHQARREKQVLLRTYGFGVPDLGRALYSARNALTLIVQDTIQPFAQLNQRRVTNEMRFHKLPWPRQALLELGKQTVELRVTLSYFIEPSPGERQPVRRYAYASHGLRFDMQAVETEQQFARRVSKALLAEGEKAETKADTEGWMLGARVRHRGSIHSDRWKGSAAELATREHIAVFPSHGWWLDRQRERRAGSQARYALVVSIHAPAVGIDLYTPGCDSDQRPDLGDEPPLVYRTSWRSSPR